MPYANDLVSVTILSDQSVDGDALSTSCFALGAKKGMELVENIKNTEAVFITENGEFLYSSGFPVSDKVKIQKGSMSSIRNILPFLLKENSILINTKNHINESHCQHFYRKPSVSFSCSRKPKRLFYGNKKNNRYKY